MTRLSRGAIAACVGVGLVGTVLWGWYLATRTDAAMPYRDAFIAAFSILAQWLQARKKLENWIAWMVVNAAAVAVYWIAGLYWFAVLYVLFFILAWMWGADAAARWLARQQQPVPERPSS